VTERQRVRAAVLLWLVFAGVVWNVIFDRMLFLAGRRYSHDAMVLFRRTGQYLRIDDVMRPAATEAAWVASSAALVIAAVALALIRFASAYDRRRRQT
jgi:hypothetical protein